jgi:LysR family hydrogen peroxide-inducible transcriptional activator
MDLSQVTLAMMRYAVLVAETRSFRVAAERAFVSQPGLSMQLAKLEELLGVSLFDRAKKPTLVTPEGEKILAQFRVILRETERLAQVTHQDEEPSGTYRLGIIPTMAPTILPLFLDAFLKACPKVELVVEELQTAHIIERLREDRLEAGLLSTPLSASGLDEIALGAERLLAYLSPGDELLARKTVTEEDLRSRRLWVMPEGHCFRTQVLSYCGARRGKLKDPAGVQFESGSFETLIRLVDSGLGATVLPELVAHGLGEERRSAQVRPFRGTTPVREIGLVTSRRELHEKVTARLLTVLQKHVGGALRSGALRSLVRLDPLAE